MLPVADNPASTKAPHQVVSAEARRKVPHLRPLVRKRPPNGGAWARNAAVHMNMAGWGWGWAQFLTATPSGNCNTLAVHYVWCGEGNFPFPRSASQSLATAYGQT